MQVASDVHFSGSPKVFSTLLRLLLQRPFTLVLGVLRLECHSADGSSLVLEPGPALSFTQGWEE